MSDIKNLVLKLTINSTDFENSLKNAKNSMKGFEAYLGVSGKAIKSLISGISKSFAGLGLAVGATEMFKSFIDSTQTMSDAWGNAMETAKTSFQVLETAVATGSSTILDNFSKSIAAAKEFAAAMDALGSAQISNQYARMSYLTPFNEEMTKYRNAKRSGDTTGMAFAAANMQRYLGAYEENSKNILSSSRAAVGAKLSAYTAGFVNQDNMDKYIDQLYLELINGVFPPILQDFKNLDKELEKGDYFYNQAKEEMEKRYGPGWRREAEAMNALAEINDKALNEMLEVIKTYDSVRNEINGMRRQMNNTLKGEGSTKPTSSSSSASSGLTIDQLTEYYIRMMQRVPIENFTPYEPMLLEEDIIEEETDAIVDALIARRKAMEGLAQQTAETITMFNSLASVFNELGKLSGDDMFGSIASGLGSLISTATQTISAMMALAGAETVEGIAEVFARTNGGMVTKIAVTATALAGILSMINTAKNAFAGSFADGGIIGGNSYSGDKLWARVNSGEMILNRSQQAALMNGGNVKFVIEGSQLKGVLDNYESIQSM